MCLLYFVVAMSRDWLMVFDLMWLVWEYFSQPKWYDKCYKKNRNLHGIKVFCINEYHFLILILILKVNPICKQLKISVAHPGFLVGGIPWQGCNNEIIFKRCPGVDIALVTFVKRQLRKVFPKTDTNRNIKTFEIFRRKSQIVVDWEHNVVIFNL